MASVLFVLVGLGYAYNTFSTFLLNLVFLQERYLLQLSFLALAMVASLPIAMWQITGTWRAIVKAASAGGNVVKIFGVVGRLLLAIFAVWSAWQIFPSFVDLSRALGGVARASDKYEISSSLVNGGQLKFKGEIAWNASVHFEKLLASRPDIVRLELDSPGGSIQEATRIANVVKARRLTTFVSGECLSACTLIFSAGRPRIASASAKFGFHRPVGSSLVSKDYARKMVDEYANALLTNGVDHRFVSQAISVIPPYIWIPDKNDLQMSKFVEQFVE